MGTLADFIDTANTGIGFSTNTCSAAESATHTAPDGTVTSLTVQIARRKQHAHLDPDEETVSMADVAIKKTDLTLAKGVSGNWGTIAIGSESWLITEVSAQNAHVYKCEAMLRTVDQRGSFRRDGV